MDKAVNHFLRAWDSPYLRIPYLIGKRILSVTLLYVAAIIVSGLMQILLEPLSEGTGFPLPWLTSLVALAIAVVFILIGLPPKRR